ncbi:MULTISPECIES: hypothetical protein [unclassified Luteimonas]
MQFELSGKADAAMLSTAMRPLDPDAKIALDLENGRLEVISSASSEQIVAALRKVGYAAEPLVQELHISGGSTCCGGCS